MWRPSFRTLTADVPGELLAAQVAASRTAAATPANVPHETVATDPYDQVFAILGAIADNPGVLTSSTPGLPVPARTEGDMQ